MCNAGSVKDDVGYLFIHIFEKGNLLEFIS